jgi:LacI family transcriptional regulator
LCKRLHKLKKVTIHGIAKTLNITPSTVSRALNDNPRISEETRRLVKEAAEKAGYRVNGIASALRSGRTFTIGVIVPTADRSFFSGVVRGIEDIASNASYNVMICQSYDDHQSELDNIAALLRAQVDGILMSYARGTTTFQHLEKLRKQAPLVLFDRVIFQPGISTVRVDDFRGGYQATQHLIEQGCRRIATFTSIHRHLDIYKERLRGYQEALQDYGLPPCPEYIHYNDLTLEGGQAGASFLWGLPEPPDAIFCASDLSALGAMRFLKSRCIPIPQEVALVGFANEPFTSFVEPALSTVNQHPIEMGQAATRLFLEQIQAAPGTFVEKHITLSADLIVRQSSMRKT